VGICVCMKIKGNTGETGDAANGGNSDIKRNKKILKMYLYMFV
jgi:hypothetical protein